MKVLRDSDDLTIDACVLTTGAFDGVHLGHRKVIETVRERADALGVSSAVVTFDRHPALVVRPESAPKLLTRLERKLELLEQIGVDCVYVIEFDDERASTTADEFIRDVFVRRLGVKEVFVGRDFHFGKGREGTVELLAERGLENSFAVTGLELVRLDDAATEHISSTAIRRALTGGDVESVEAMLGRAFEIHGVVVQGDQRGRLLGFPTANVVLADDMARPANGVYACEVELASGGCFVAAVNIGVRPTFYETAEGAVLEAHLLDFDEEIYGQEVRVRFKRFLRSERRFNGIEELKAQLDLDIADTRRVSAD